jgi:hemolysin activation/secretion protein
LIRPLLVTVGALLVIWTTFDAVAQTTPDAGSLRQQLERERQLQPPRLIAPGKPAEPAAMEPAAGVAVTVREFRFAGNTLIPSEQLAPVVAGYLNRPLDFAQLQAAAAALTAAYREAGWIARVYLPAQEVAAGVITFQIVEAVFGGARLEGAESSRVGSAQVLDLIDAQQPSGELLNTAALDRGLLLADDLPGVRVAGVLTEGARPGETALLVKLDDEPLLAGEVSADNTGARSTGRARLGAQLILNSPLGWGDLLSANLLHSEGSDYLRLAGSVPVGSDGWRLGANASVLGYRLVAPEFSGLDAHGDSWTTGLDANYPLIRSQLQSLYLRLNYDHKRFDNQFGGATTTRYGIDAVTVALNGNLLDTLGGGGANSAGLALVRGKVDLAGSPNQAADAATTQVAGHFGKLRYALSRQQVLTQEISMFAALTGQRAGKNLDSAEKFYLGGASGVRAYPDGEAGGAHGQIVNLELRARLPENFIVTGFYDWGRVTVNRNNSFTGAPALNAYCLQGAGISVGWVAEVGLNLRATWARRIGENPNPTITGNDQDGSLIRHRFWFTASFSF